MIEAVKTYAFWGSTASLTLFALLGTAMTFHIVSIGEIYNLTPSESVKVFRPMTVVAVCVNLYGGWLSDRIRARWILLAQLLGLALGAFGATRFGSSFGQYSVIVGFGIANGLFPLLMTILWPRFFGRVHLGAISGFNMALTVAGSALGPKIFALEFEETGNFNSSFLICMVVALTLAVFALGVDNPQLKKTKTTEAS